MKQIFTFILSGFIAISSTGQSQHRNKPSDAEKHLKNRVDFPVNIQEKALEYSKFQPVMYTRQLSPQPKQTLVLMQQLDSYVYQEYDELTSQWLNRSKNVFSYDASGNNTSDIFYEWNTETELFVETGKQEFVYETGNLSQQIYYEWDAVAGEWVTVFRWLYSYNEDGLMSMAYSYFWNGTGWEMAGKDQRTFDENGNLVLRLLAWWDGTGSQWINSSKEEHSYNINGDLSVSTSYTWDMFTNEWLNVSMNEYAYNTGGYMISNTYREWNSVAQQWENLMLEEYIYDINLNIVLTEENAWDGSQWVESWKSEMTYNNDYTAGELILPWYFEEVSGQLQHMLTNITDYGFNGLSYVLASNSDFNYSQVNITGIEENEIRQAMVYPQPAKEQVTFSWKNSNQLLELSLYDLNGKTVSVQTIENNTSIPVADLTPGIYFYRLAGKAGTLYTGKLSVR
ncbi:MAG: T9SS type A sorting domain-containing protein [Bacteroidales bacterium]|nr:T9SS type A sorting domain-containing protein [Bacteroidales bacterium]